jgi:hypothetical protein
VANEEIVAARAWCAEVAPTLRFESHVISSDLNRMSSAVTIQGSSSAFDGYRRVFKRWRWLLLMSWPSSAATLNSDVAFFFSKVPGRMKKPSPNADEHFRRHRRGGVEDTHQVSSVEVMMKLMTDVQMQKALTQAGGKATWITYFLEMSSGRSSWARCKWGLWPHGAQPSAWMRWL